MKISREKLLDFYNNKKYSAKTIAAIYKCSESNINYWLHKYRIKKRSVSEAIYVKKNPTGDPFLFKKPKNLKEATLFGLGLGLYWGEGNKKNKYGIRVGNVDPHLILKFMEFLEKIYGVKRKKFRFGLQVFSDMNSHKALTFWHRYLKVPRGQFQKVIITKEGGIGTYKNKTKHGVLTVQVYNKKLRDIIVNKIENLRKL